MSTRTGIIPARAGFTWPCPPRGAGRRDHPRSRGVYYERRTFQSGRIGSSPLARGLLYTWQGGWNSTRIIPARAGFTDAEQRPRLAGADHPRSRGVYARVRRAVAAATGSSPLARGLPPKRRSRTPGRGIIPARAGFTPPHVLRHTYHPDHPRSRGVYSTGRHGGRRE